ncbi:hypothetical protein D3Z47_05520 [Lachnospiraceae bacterium]|nr:hypothetical protein [Lachnospiraceae bacterium]
MSTIKNFVFIRLLSLCITICISGTLSPRLIITYSPKSALYQKTIREKQVDRTQKMLESGSTKKNRNNPNDPARFIETTIS